MEIKVKLPDHGARFCAKLPPRVRAEQFRCMGWRVLSNVHSYRHSMETKSLPNFGRLKLGDIGLMITTWGISEHLIVVPGESGGSFLSWLLLGATMSN
jgi:hypothetical protein